MNGVLIGVLALMGLMLGMSCCLGWQLLRQNGRMLLRLEELEERLERLDEWEFGEQDSHESERSNQKSGMEQELEASPATNGQEQANRFRKRSLARSKIKRDGLKSGTVAPSFS